MDLIAHCDETVELLIKLLMFTEEKVIIYQFDSIKVIFLVYILYCFQYYIKRIGIKFFEI